MRRCTQCILPERFPSISFDDAGVCNYCRDYHTAQRPKALGDLNTLIAWDGNREYDCIVPISGGRDSAYVLHQVVKKYGLRPLAYHYDNGFTTDRARCNVEMMTRNLGVDINIKASRGNYQVKLMRENFALNTHKSLLHILRDICNGCRNGYKGGSFLLAREKQIKYIIFGDSKIEESLYKKTIFNRIARGKTDKLHDACLHPWNFIKRHYYDYRLRGEFPLTREEQAGSAVIHFFDYEPWDEDVIIQTITQEDGWSSGHEHATWRIDCKVHLIADYLTLSELGFNEKDEILSKLVREGKISREHALERLANLRQDSIKSLSKLDDVFQEYNLNRDILDKLLQKMD